MSQPLSPCPFCGGHAEVMDAMSESWATCTNDICHASGPTRNGPVAAAVAWNKRAAPVVTDEMVEQASDAYMDIDGVPVMPGARGSHNKAMRAAITAALATDGQAP